MNDSLLQFERIVLGNDFGCSYIDQLKRIKQPENKPVIERAFQVRQFFHNGWFRLFSAHAGARTPIERKATVRDTHAFYELSQVECILRRLES